MTEQDERELVDRLRRAAPGAFDAAYARYKGRVYAFLLRLSGRRDVADDLFQDTFLQLARCARSLRPDTNLAAWIFTVARNAYRSHRRWARLDLSRLAAIGDDTSYFGAPHCADDAIDSAKRLLRVERALARLSPASREALLLVGVAGVEQESAAIVVGVTYSAFRQRLARARGELERALEREGRLQS